MQPQTHLFPSLAWLLLPYCAKSRHLAACVRLQRGTLNLLTAMTWTQPHCPHPSRDPCGVLTYPPRAW
jgi:hypothetical protein